MDDRIEELEKRIEELEKVIEGFQRALKGHVGESMWTQSAELILSNMGKAVMSYRPPVSSK